MKLHKTPQSRRSTYSYQFYDESGASEPHIIIRPGENDVTEIDIKRLHALDDSEVYYNIKSQRPEESKSKKAEKAIWRAQFIADFVSKHGYPPHAQDVADAVNEAFPKGWTTSLDELLDGDEDADGCGDKSAVLADLCTKDDSSESPQQGRLHELIDRLTPKEQEVYRRVLLNGEKKCAVAACLGISDVRVSQIAKKIRAIIAGDEILQKYFR